MTLHFHSNEIRPPQGTYSLDMTPELNVKRWRPFKMKVDGPIKWQTFGLKAYDCSFFIFVSSAFDLNPHIDLPTRVMDHPRKIRVTADFALSKKFDFRKTWFKISLFFMIPTSASFGMKI